MTIDIAYQDGVTETIRGVTSYTLMTSCAVLELSFDLDRMRVYLDNGVRYVDVSDGASEVTE